MEGMLLNIQRFCVHDGPGIRTTVFFKGCPLRCAWCHNPESHRRQPEILFSAKDCIRCGACAAACPQKLHAVDREEHFFDRSSCIACGECAAACPAGALELCGKWVGAEEVLSQVLRDGEFYRASGGGLTLSGGEPMAQSGFALELARTAKRAGLHVSIETCGYCAQEEFERILPYADLFLYDFKIEDSETHKLYTGKDNLLIKENLGFLSRAGAAVILRCPIIPGVNCTEEHFAAIAQAVKSHAGILQVDLEPYHPLGIDKLKRLDRPIPFDEKSPLSPKQIAPYQQKLQNSISVPVTCS